ncbi:MAG: DUF1059 domain-containing protein [Thermoplasmata archaeon]
MRYYFRCKDYGFDCSYEIEEEKKEDIVAPVKMHFRYAHGIYDFTDDIKKKVEDTIKSR